MIFNKRQDYLGATGQKRITNRFFKVIIGTREEASNNNKKQADKDLDFYRAQLEKANAKIADLSKK